MFDQNSATDSDNLEDLPCLAVRWHFVIRDACTEFLDGVGKLGELSDLATMILAETEHSRDELPRRSRRGTGRACTGASISRCRCARRRAPIRASRSSARFAGPTTRPARSGKTLSEQKGRGAPDNQINVTAARMLKNAH